MKPLKKLVVKNPLAHCQLRMVRYYEWVKVSNAHPPGSNVSQAAHNKYQEHMKKCEVCIEYEEGQHGKSKDMFQVQEGVAP